MALVSSPDAAGNLQGGWARACAMCRVPSLHAGAPAECCPDTTPHPCLPCPTADGGRDLESQYTTAQGEVGTGSETRSLREKYGSMSSLGTGGAPTPPTQSAAPSGAPSAAHSAGTVSSGGGRRLMQASQEALRGSQQAFRGLAAGASQLSRGDSQLHSTSSLGGPARARSTAGAPNPLRQSLTASTGCNAGGSTLSGSALVASAAAGATFASATPVLGDTQHTLKSVSSSGRGGSRPDSAAHSSSNNSGEGLGRAVEELVGDGETGCLGGVCLLSAAQAPCRPRVVWL